MFSNIAMFSFSYRIFRVILKAYENNNKRESDSVVYTFFHHHLFKSFQFCRSNLSVHIQIPTRANTQNITGWMVCRETPICLYDKAFALLELVNFCNVKSSKMLTVQKDLTICPIIICLQWTRKTN